MVANAIEMCDGHYVCYQMLDLVLIYVIPLIQVGVIVNTILMNFKFNIIICSFSNQILEYQVRYKQYSHGPITFWQTSQQLQKAILPLLPKLSSL